MKKTGIIAYAVMRFQWGIHPLSYWIQLHKFISRHYEMYDYNELKFENIEELNSLKYSSPPQWTLKSEVWDCPLQELCC